MNVTTQIIQSRLVSAMDTVISAWRESNFGTIDVPNPANLSELIKMVYYEIEEQENANSNPGKYGKTVDELSYQEGDV